jgi:hypothetical protein
MENFFEQFHGSDLDNLCECIQAVKLAGLTIDKHTQAGKNERTGNVWIYNEDWAGTVFSSNLMAVQWLHYCFECGEEYTFDNYEDLVAYADKHHGQCEKCVEQEVAA